MCFDTDSRPPIPPMQGAAVDGRSLELTAADGNTFAAFAALAEQPSGASILVLPDVRGLHRYYEELALRFAEAGIDALAIDYFGRTAGIGDRGSSFDFQAHVPQTRWAGLAADAAAGAGWLRAERSADAVYTIGFCFGGRLSFALGSRGDLGLAGVIGFYGPTVGPGRVDVPAPVDLAAQTACPVLGIFGGADPAIPADAVAAYDQALATAGVEHTIITYPDAPHSFFDRKQEEFADASAAAWGEVLGFVRTHSPGGG
jgi:carboxymethylenebutenolidase